VDIHSGRHWSFAAESIKAMKAFLLAAGYGTRLRPLTDSVPKCLVPICGEPLLSIWLEQCSRFGVDDVVINVHAHGDAVAAFLREHRSPVRVTVSEEPVLLGSAGTLRAHRKWVEQESLFWVFYADVLNRVDLGLMLHCHRRRNVAATIGVYRVPDPWRCGVVEVDAEGMVGSFVEKPADPAGNLVFSGIMIATPAFLDEIPEDSPVDIGAHVLPRLAGRMAAYEIHEYLTDIGTMANYQAAQLSWLAETAHALGNHL
jgi:mannose-1-phosphate guanylyltransferase